MKASRFVVKNTALLSIGLFTGRLLGFFIYRRLTGLEGAAGTGIWAAAADITSIFIVVSNYGLGALITREIVKQRERTASLFWAALKIRMTLGLAAYGLIVVYVNATGFEPLVRQAVLVMALGVMIESASMACDSVLQAHEKVQYQTYSQLLSAAVYFGLAWMLLDAGWGVMGVLWANLASRVARLLLIAPLMARSTGTWRGVSGGVSGGVSTRWLLKLAFPVFLGTTFGQIAYKVDTVMIIEMLGEQATGIYNAGHRALDLLIMVPALFATALFPSLQRYRETGEKPLEDVARMASRALRYLHLMIFPITMVCVLGAVPLVRLLAKGDEFAPAAGVFRIVILGLVLNAANTVYNRVLLAMGREKTFIRLAGAVMIVNVGLNLLLIPWLKWYGAAIATVVSQIVSHLLHRRYIRFTGIRIPWMRGHLGGTAALLLAWAASVPLINTLLPSWDVTWTHLPESDWFAFVGSMIVTGVIYAGLLFALKVLNREDLSMIRDLRRGA